MAQVIEGGETGSSNLVQGTGTNSATFTMPKTGPLEVESVVATVNNAAGGDTTAKLTVKDQSGEVIATKRQDDVIPAGDTGTATFARRLDNTGGGIRYGRLNVGNWLNVRTRSDLNPGTGGVTFEVEKSEFGIYVTDAVTGAFRVEAPFVTFDVGGGVYRISNSSLVEVNATEFSVITTGPWSVANATASIDGTAGGDVNVNASGDIFLNLPTVAPATSGALWNNAGFVKVVP